MIDFLMLEDGKIIIMERESGGDPYIDSISFYPSIFVEKIHIGGATIRLCDISHVAAMKKINNMDLKSFDAIRYTIGMQQVIREIKAGMYKDYQNWLISAIRRQ